MEEQAQDSSPSLCVLVSSGFDNNYLTRDGFPNKHLFLTILQCDKSRIELPADVVPGEDSLPDLQMATFLYLHMAEREKQAVPFLFFLGH